MFDKFKILGKVGSFLFKHKKTGKVSRGKALVTSIATLIIVLLTAAGLSPEISQALADVLVNLGLYATGVE